MNWPVEEKDISTRKAAPSDAADPVWDSSCKTATKKKMQVAKEIRKAGLKSNC